MGRDTTQNSGGTFQNVVVSKFIFINSYFASKALPQITIITTKLLQSYSDDPLGYTLHSRRQILKFKVDSELALGIKCSMDQSDEGFRQMCYLTATY